MATAAATTTTTTTALPPLGELADLSLSPTELVGMTKAVLQAVCGAKGVGNSGSKEDMVRRLCGPRPDLPVPQGHETPVPQQLSGKG